MTQSTTYLVMLVMMILFCCRTKYKHYNQWINITSLKDKDMRMLSLKKYNQLLSHIINISISVARLKNKRKSNKNYK